MSDAEKDVSNCVETVNGFYLDPINPTADQISIDDIAWGLSRISRFAGHTITAVPYNVAQHCVYVSELAEAWLDGRIELDDAALHYKQKDLHTRFYKTFQGQELILKCLMHDGHESYTGDIPSPIKRLPGMKEVIKGIEIAIDKAIYECFNISENDSDTEQLIKYFDKLAQAIEAYQFMPDRGRRWKGLPKPTLMMIQQFPHPKPSLESYNLFLKRYWDVLPIFKV